MDSIHGSPLANAKVMIEGTSRTGMTTAEGQYRIDSIPPGPHRVVVTHALLDTVGLSMRTPEYQFKAGIAHDLDLAIPPGEKIASAICTMGASMQAYSTSWWCAAIALMTFIGS